MGNWSTYIKDSFFSSLATSTLSREPAKSITFSTDSVVFDKLISLNDTSTLLTEPKKSRIGTMLGSLLKRSVLVPTVDIQTDLGQTRKNSAMVFLESGVTRSKNSKA